MTPDSRRADSLLDAGDADQVGAVVERDRREGRGAVAVAVGFQDGDEPARAGETFQRADVGGERAERHFRPGRTKEGDA